MKFKKCLTNQIPSLPGGGTVVFVTREHNSYVPKTEPKGRSTSNISPKGRKEALKRLWEVNITFGLGYFSLSLFLGGYM